MVCSDAELNNSYWPHDIPVREKLGIHGSPLGTADFVMKNELEV